jgi:sortase B
MGKEGDVNMIPNGDIPVLFLGATAEPPCAALLRHSCRTERVRTSGDLQAQICFALMLSPTALVVGGFGGQPWPGMTDVCQALAESAEVEEADVRFRWIKDKDVPLGAELSAEDETVYVISAVPDHAQRMLRYLGALFAKAQAPPVAVVAPPAPVATPPDYRTAEIKVSEIEQRLSEPIPPAANPWGVPPPPEKQVAAGEKRQVKREKRQAKPQEQVSSSETRQVKREKQVLSREARQVKRIKGVTAGVLAVASAACVGCSVYLAHYAADSAIQKRKTAEIVALYHESEESPAVGSVAYTGSGILRKFSGLYANNSDTRGWLSIPAVEVDRPILQAQDNEYYLTHDAEKGLSRYGALFLDTGNRVLPGQLANNLSIYGHNTKNGSMFGQLSKFREQAFYEENPTFSFDTLYEEKRWVIFAVIITTADQSKSDFFEWRGEERVSTPQKAQAFLDALHERSLIASMVDVAPGDRLLSLTTCCYDYKNARLIVFARELRSGEESALTPAAA